LVSPSFADVMKGKGKAPLDAEDPRSSRDKGKAIAIDAALHRPQSVLGVVSGFMADARHA
jgi:hypothetical protein